MNEQSWANLTSGNAELDYITICEEASKNDNAFLSFKQDPRYTVMLEHVPPEQGSEYIKTIGQYDINQELILKFKENDKYGGATLIDYGEPFGNISPSTLRYIQNTLDIANFFGEGDLKKIVEIGGGYGGLCRSINCLCDFEEYHIYDLESCGKLQKKYLSNFNISGEVLFHSIPEKIENVDLVISNYAYSELSAEYQELYYDAVIQNSNKVYMILNRGQVDREVFLNKAEKDFNINVEKVLDFWPPNGHLYFTTMIKK